MSVVTNVLLLVDLEDVDVVAGMRFGRYRLCLTNLGNRENAIWGGEKFPECAMFTGSFGNLGEDFMFQQVADCPWRAPDAVRLLVKHQDDEGFRVYFLTAGKLRRAIVVSDFHHG